MQLLAELRDKKLPFLHISDKDFHNYFVAINDAISALKIIEDGNYQLKTHLNSVYEKTWYENTVSAGKIDLKTLYEQTTMYCERIDTMLTEKYTVEIFQQPNTPIIIFAYWSRKGATKLHSIAYQIGE